MDNLGDTLRPVFFDEQLHLLHKLAGVGDLRERVEAVDGVRERIVAQEGGVELGLFRISN